MHHVCEVYVLNHASTDATNAGLKHLQQIWPHRIHVFNCDDQSFQQEVSTNALIRLSRKSQSNWIYVFDADEFMLSSEPLCATLKGVGYEYAAIRYKVQNWISTSEFDDAILSHYGTLRYRSMFNAFVNMDPQIYSDEILHGMLNFFDIPFRSKIIIRNNETCWLTAGAHNLKSSNGSCVRSMSADRLRVAHFPLLSRKRVKMKIEQGRQLIQDGYPVNHGWQCQMLFRISQANSLDAFWNSHSLFSCRYGVDRTLPSYVLDTAFNRSIDPVMDLLRDKWNTLIFSS
jgi:hypothetical protein